MDHSSDHRLAHLGRRGGLLAAALLLLRILWLRSLPVNSDEPQHLHVVWAWTQGLLPYRDVFDNHTPLFHVLFAPFLALIGETSHVLTWMRLAMVPLYLLMLWCTWRLGVALWDRRIAMWAVLVCAFHPVFFELAGQFRTDVLWSALWLGVWSVALGGAFTWRRAWVSGLLVGTAFAVSLKTVLLGAGAVLGGILVLFARGHIPRRTDFDAAIGPASAFLAGVVLLPALVLAFFAGNGALGAMWYGVVEHNLVPGLGHVGSPGSHGAMFVMALLGLWWMAWRTLRAEREPGRVRRALLLLGASGYVLLLYSFWPLITHQDLLPVLPLFALALAAGVVCIARAAATPLLSGVVLLEIGLLLVQHPPWHRHPDSAFREELRTLLALTRGDEYVMDAKGSTIFRQRPWYYALEDVTRARLDRGLINDDLTQQLAATATKVVVFDRLEGKDLAFVEANYLRVRGRIGVAGQRFKLSANEMRPFDVAIAATYSEVERSGAKGEVLLDGTPFKQPRELAPGPHTLRVAEGGDYAIVWTRALAQGLSPYRADEAQE